MPPPAFLQTENAPKSLATGASPQTPLGELTVLPSSPSWIKGPTSKGRGGEGKEWEKKRGEVWSGERRGEGLETLTMLEAD